MTLSSDQFAGRGLDAMLIVYSLLDDHPASAACESFIRSHTNWFTTTLTLFEAKVVLINSHILPQMHQSPRHRAQILRNQLLPDVACCRPRIGIV